MALPAGTRLGPYEILSLLGAGGMGEVYRGRDARLGRDVAIKLLPPALAEDADRLRRFEQEARATAALNHPNILAVHDIGRHERSPYIVSELLEGETLRARLAKGSTSAVSATTPTGVSVRRAVDFAIQIAHGLSAAHDKGIVHRDLKPENLFVTADGHVKILDFGLAKLRPEPAAAHPEHTAKPTEALDTHPGMLLGTMGYMAPEQLRGQPVDHRSDIFAFGAILYEMLSGRRAFHGATPADTISAILDKDPADLPVVERHVPPALERIVDRCLAKNPSARFQAASDLAFALEALSSHSDRSEAGVAAAHVVHRSSRERLAWSVAALVIVAAIAAIGFGARYVNRSAPVVRASRSTVLLPERAQYPVGGVSPAYRLSIAPDGSKLSYAASLGDGIVRLWVRPLDALSAQPLAGTEQAAGPFWSPDSRFIGYFTNPLTALKKIDAAGGPPLTLVELASGGGGGGTGASWNRNDVILYGTTIAPGSGPIRRISAAGGTPSVVIEPDPKNGETELWYPYFLPDGEHFLFLAVGPLDGANVRPLGIYVSSLSAKERKLVMRGGSNMKYANGHLVYLREGTLMAQPFDVDRLELTGDAVPVAEQVQVGGPSGATGPFAVSDNGLLAYISGPSLGAGVQTQLVWLNREGQQMSLIGDRAPYADVELSRDGTHATVSVIEFARRTSDIWVFDVARGLRSKFTFDAGTEQASVWSPDGSRIVYSSSRTPLALYQRAADGSGPEEKLAVPPGSGVFPRSWSPDGRHVIYSAAAAAGTASPVSLDLWVLPLFGDRKPFAFVQTPATENFARFSPDGRWIAYQSDESGRNEVYVAPFPGPGGKSLISTSGGIQPRWRGDGAELFYLSPSDNKLMAASVNGRGTGFQVVGVRALFDVRQRSGARSQYDVTPDGQRFLFNTSVDQEQSTPPITLVTNWHAGLKGAKAP